MGYLNSRAYALVFLGVKEGYSPTELKSAYLKKAKIFHPDAGGTHEEFLKLQEAYEYLKDTPLPSVVYEEVVSSNNSPGASDTFTFTNKSIGLVGLLRKIRVIALELFVVFFSNSSYLVKATSMQFIFFGIWFNNLYAHAPSIKTFEWLFQLICLSTYLLMVILLLTLVITLFYKENWFKFFKLERFAPKKLNYLRNVSVFLFALATLPGYFGYLAIYLSLKIIGLIINLVK